MLDFGSTLGSGSVEAQLPWLGYNYWLDFDLVKHNIVTFGFSTPTYHKVDFREFPSIGRIEAEAYEPHEWRNDYPNPAFVRMTNRDAFWASKIMMGFTREELAAIVKTAEFSDLEAEAHLLDVIVKRQRKTGAYYFDRVNPLDEFRITSTALEFTNLAETYDFEAPGTTYNVPWFTYDNPPDTTTPLDAPVHLSSPVARLPASTGLDDADMFLMAEVRAVHDAHDAWNTPVRVYLRATSGSFEVVGIDR